MGRFLRHGEGYPDKSVRLFNKHLARWSNDSVHEKVESINNNILSIDSVYGDLMHNSAESISQYILKQNLYTDLQAQKILESKRRISVRHLIVNPTIRFFKYYFLKKGFLDGVAGFVHITIGCVFVFIKYAKVLSLQSRCNKDWN